MNLQRITALVKKELKKVIRDPTTLFTIIFLPVILVLAFGLSLSKIPSSANPGQSIFEVMLPGVYGFTCVYLIMTVAIAFVDDRNQGLIKRINTTRTTSGEFIGSHIISNILLALLQVAIITVLSVILGVSFNPTGFLFAFVFIGLLSLCSIGFGLICATFAKTSGAASGIASMIMVPQLILGTWLLTLVPTTQVAAMFFPIYYATNSIDMLFRGVPLTEITIWINLVVLAIYSIVILIIGIKLFKRYGNE
jgi:ABC-2 type transport system permease protein